MGRRSAWEWFLDIGIWLLFVVLLVPAVVLGFVIGHSSKQKTKTIVETPAQAAKALITRAPRFTTAQLDAQPSSDWITNGGSLANDRYSTLSQIDTSNVAQLKGVWEAHLRGSGIGAKYSGESQPLEYKGIIYVPTGADDVFAINAQTGEILWEYKANLNQEISVVCCGWESRGVAIGDGRVYIGQLDGKLVALDQQTGQVEWTKQVASWQDGYSITAAPLYVDGMVITGISGGEFSTRGMLSAYDAATGRQRWRFYTIPGPGQFGHDTWPNNNSWKIGGAPIWQTPSVDPNLGLLYFTTGNAGPDNNGAQRAGKNLFTASFVALDVKTGKLRWAYQMVHHDIWDYDAPSPTLLFDAKIHGKTVHGIGEAEKTGWLYLLNRATGKPLFPTPEKPVPQNKNQHTWPTQPFPSYAPVVPHMPSQAQVKQVETAAVATTGHKVKAVAAKAMFTPYWTTLTVFTPGPQGGTNWQPSSYNPNTHMAYVCAQSGPTGNTAIAKLGPIKQGGVHTENVGGSLTIAGGFGQNPGTFSAIDVTTGKIVWQKRWPESCYAGSATTAGNIVFIGRSDGRLMAFNATNGKGLWQFQTGGGANDAPTIFESNGTEYVAFYAGGNALAGSPHSDNFWLFGLDGTLNQVAAPGPGQGIQHAGATKTSPKQKSPRSNTTGAAGNAAAGKIVFASNCSTCHGALGTGGNGGPNLKSIPSAKNLQVVIGQVTNGGGGMPAFKGQLTQTQINDVATFVVTDITHGSTK
jgi:alcohol dehydrogenase (cytochrome c)